MRVGIILVGGCIQNVTFRRLTIDSTAYGLRIKTWNGSSDWSSSFLRDVTFDSIHLRNTGPYPAIIVNQFYGMAHNHPELMPPGKCKAPWLTKITDRWPEPNVHTRGVLAAGGPRGTIGIPIHGITYRDIRIEHSQSCPGIFACSVETNCTGIVMENVSAVRSEVSEFDCANAYGTANDVSPKACLLGQ